MSEVRQIIVRRLLSGEFTPSYSTDELLRGVCHIVRNAAPEQRDDDARSQPARDASLRFRKNRASALFLKRFDTVKQMLEDYESNIKIADTLSISVKTIQRYIAKNPELYELWKAKPACGRGKMEYSEARFREQESAIRRALKRDALWVVALRFGFGRRTLKRLLGETK